MAAAVITVTQTGAKEPLEFDVVVSEGGSQTRHRVTMRQSTYTALAKGGVSAAACVHATFLFLLDHEPKESILSRFDVTVVSRYFPQFERELPRYLKKLASG